MQGERAGLPEWIRPAVRKRPYLEHLGPRLRALGISTVCESARCPNLGECFSNGEATFLLMGEVCTRNCRFCAVETGKPAPLDEDEPRRVARAVKELGLKHVVLTSVTRDDLADGGAGHFIAAMREIRELVPEASVEILVPDFGGNAEAVRAVVEAGPEIFAHNVETVPRLYAKVRPQAVWERSLEVLRKAREESTKASKGAISPCATRPRRAKQGLNTSCGGGWNPRPTTADTTCIGKESADCSSRSLLVKSGLMVGLGESREEILEVFRELRSVGVDILTVGQYLQPTPEHLPVVEYLPMGAYEEFAAAAKGLGFRSVSAAPLVRSSYHAGQMAQGKAR